MSSHSIAILVTIGFSAVGVVGDYFLKLASQQETPLRSVWFYVGSPSMPRRPSAGYS